MALNDNIFFTSSNLIENSVITVNQEPVTPKEYVFNSKRARQTRWVNPDGVVNMNFVLGQTGTLSYFAIPGHDLPDTASIRFLAYDVDDNLLHNTGYLVVGSLKPAGEFIAGVDKWNTTVGALENIVFKSIEPVFDVARVHVSIDHGYTYEETESETETETTIISDEVLRQDTNGVVSIEAENCEIIGSGGDAWTQVVDSAASGGQAMYKSGPEFYWTAGTGPKLRFKFTASQSGSHKIWLRLKSIDGNSIYTTFDGNPQTSVFVPAATFRDGTWKWKNTQTVNLIAGQKHTVEISARDHFIYIDKIIILPNGDPEPVGNGPNESEFGTITIDTVTGIATTQVFQNFVNIRMVMAGEILQLQENFEYGAVMKYLTDSLDYQTESGFTVTGKVANKVRSLSIQLAVMNDRDRRVMIQLKEKMRGRAFIVSAYPNSSGYIESKHTFLATFENGTSYSHDRDDIHSTNLILNEV